MIESFDDLNTLEQNWLTIANEVADLPEDSIDVSWAKTRAQAAEAVFKSGKMQWVEGWDGYKNWLAWGLVLDGEFLDGMPQTRKLLENVRGLQFAAILNMRGCTIMRNHAHPENAGLLTYHLGLFVPEECYLKADGNFYQHETGKGLIFDGTKPHYAFNASGTDRFILHCEGAFYDN